MWGRRIEENIKQDRRDLFHLKILHDGGQLKIEDNLYRKKKGVNAIKELLKQRVMAKAAKIKMFKQQCDRYKGGKLFCHNQRQFYKNLSHGTSTVLLAA